MGISLPVESQPLAIAILSALVMVSLGGWLGWKMFQGIRMHWRSPTARPGLQLFLLLWGSLLLQVLAIVYILDKDITAIPRYNFISYPVLLILFAIGLTPRSGPHPASNAAAPVPGDPPPDAAASLGSLPVSSFPSALSSPPASSSPPAASLPISSLLHAFLHRPLLVALIAGCLSTLLTVHGIVFQKGYYPHRVAQDMTVFAEQPLLVAVSYQSLQEVALGLSFALEIAKRYSSSAQNDPAYFAFIDRTDSYNAAWQKLRTMKHDIPLPLNLWAIASPGMKTKDYPPTLKIRRPRRNRKTTCTIDPDHFHRIGFPYQLFRCP